MQTKLRRLRAIRFGVPLPSSGMGQFRIFDREESPRKDRIRLLKNPHPDPFSQRARKWIKSLDLPPAEAFLIENSMMLLEDLDDRIDAADQQLLAIASVDASARLLITIPGVAITVATGLVAAIGDIKRFESPSKLASYFGLVPRVSQSAARCHHGGITKAGTNSGRALAFEATQILARSSSPLTATYWRVRRKRGHALLDGCSRRPASETGRMLHFKPEVRQPASLESAADARIQTRTRARSLEQLGRRARPGASEIGWTGR